MPRYKKWFLTGVLTIAIIFLSTIILTSCLTGEPKTHLSVSSYPASNAPPKSRADSNRKTVLKILTLNMAHGRKDSLHQFFLRTKTIKSNLDDIVSILVRESPDLVGMQEADGPSAWSGNFNHVAYIAEKSGYTYSIQGEHVRGMLLSYGTALLSRYPLIDPLSITFRPSPPTFPKGFVLAGINYTGETETRIVSVHFDFFRKSVRKRQVQEVIEQVSAHKKSLIVMGDFNCEWEKGSAVKTLATELNLSAYKVDAGNLTTFLPLQKRVDWILISKDFEFITYKAVLDIVSDHYGVISEIRKKIEY